MIARNIKRILAVLGTIALIGATTACSGSKAEVAGVKKTDSVEKVRIGLVTTGAVRPALVVAANELGYYAEEGLDVEFIPLDDSAQGIAALGTGKLEIWPYAVTPSLSQIAQGNDLVIFAGTATEGSSMVKGKGNEDVDFRDYQNWVGKDIAYSPTSTTHPLILKLLKDNGVNPDDINWVDISNEEQVLEALKKGSVDAGFLTEERLIVGQKSGLVEAFQLAEVLGNYVCCRQTANGTYFKEHRDTFKKIIRAQIRALRDYRDDTPKVVKAVSDYIDQDYEYVEHYIATPNPVATGAFAQYKNPVSPDPLYNKVEELYNAQIEAGFFTPAEGVDLKDHFDISLFEEAAKELIEEYPDDKAYQEILDLFYKNNSNY